MLKDLSGYWYIDGIDTWATFRLLFTEASTNLLQLPPRKPPLEHNWPDRHGVAEDNSEFYFGPRDIPLKCGIQTQTEADFWLKYNAFVQLITKPGTRRFSIKAHGQKSYFLTYRTCSPWTKVRGLKGLPNTDKVFYFFTLTMREPEPGSNNDSGTAPILSDDRKPILS